MNSRDMLHLSPKRDLDPLITNVHKSVDLLLRQDKLLQLERGGTVEKSDSFQWEELSDHFQPRPDVELVPLPPIQQPFLVSLHRFSAKLSSADDSKAAKCPP